MARLGRSLRSSPLALGQMLFGSRGGVSKIAVSVRLAASLWPAKRGGSAEGEFFGILGFFAVIGVAIGEPLEITLL